MDINALKKMSYEEVRHLYMPFLQSQGVGPNTIKTAYVDSFYLWRKGDHDLFWKAVESNDADAKAMLLDALRKNTTGDAEKLVSGYLSHLRRFRLFLASEGTAEPKTVAAALTKPTAPVQYRRKADIDVPTPSKEQVESYLAKWDALENYHLQEDALDKLFEGVTERDVMLAFTLMISVTAKAIIASWLISAVRLSVQYGRESWTTMVMWMMRLRPSPFRCIRSTRDRASAHSSW